MPTLLDLERMQVTIAWYLCRTIGPLLLEKIIETLQKHSDAMFMKYTGMP